jgi:hypothetical protein
VEYLIKNDKVFLFRSAEKNEKDKKFSLIDNKLMSMIKEIKTIKTRHIQNILSESAKLAIRNYIDQIA